jgi:ribosomal protein L37AE/L43A
MPAMADSQVPRLVPPADRVVAGPERAEQDDRMICERCGKAEMYRMHAVWRCPECGFKTDCCGW